MRITSVKHMKVVVITVLKSFYRLLKVTTICLHETLKIRKRDCPSESSCHVSLCFGELFPLLQNL
jgi:hypothetical protein